MQNINQGIAKNIHLELQDDTGNKLRNSSKKIVEVGEYSFFAILPLVSEQYLLMVILHKEYISNYKC